MTICKAESFVYFSYLGILMTVHAFINIIRMLRFSALGIKRLLQWIAMIFETIFKCSNKCIFKNVSTLCN